MIRVPERPRPPIWWLLLALVGGVVAGIALGLAISWGLWPVEYVDVAPASLRPSHREEYLVLVSLAYAYDRDLGLAKMRLAGLGQPDAGAEVATLAERYAAEGGNVRYIRSLALLAGALGYHRSALAAYLPEATVSVGPAPMPTWTALPTETPTPTETSTPLPTDTPTPIPTDTPHLTRTPMPTQTLRHTPVVTPHAPTPTPTVTPTPEPRFVVSERRRLCTELPPGVLAVTVLDDKGEPLPNAELLVRWEGGEDYFFTGLKPERGVGYADFAMQEGVEYRVVVVGMESEVAQRIVADRCDGGRVASWRVVFRLHR